MFSDLSDIKRIRKRLDLTQHELAKKAGISQSLIAKIEAGKIDPTYSKACMIFETLKGLSDQKKVKAKAVMNKKIISASPKEKITRVIADMRKHSISQLPVLDHNNLVGFISESTILNAMLEGKKIYVDEIMDDRPPSVSMETSLDIVSDLLRYFPMVTVFEKEKIVGLITKSDILANL